jgi:hypothetical protein
MSERLTLDSTYKLAGVAALTVISGYLVQTIQTQRASHEPEPGTTDTVCTAEKLDYDNTKLGIWLTRQVLNKTTISPNRAESDAEESILNGACGFIVNGMAVRLGGVSCHATYSASPTSYDLTCVASAAEATPAFGEDCAYNPLVSDDSPACVPILKSAN